MLLRVPRSFIFVKRKNFAFFHLFLQKNARLSSIYQNYFVSLCANFRKIRKHFGKVSLISGKIIEYSIICGNRRVADAGVRLVGTKIVLSVKFSTFLFLFLHQQHINEAVNEAKNNYDCGL